MKHKELLRTLKFVLFSISAGLIEIIAFSLLNELTGWSYWPCYLIALILSVLWNFTLNRRYTFQSASNAEGLRLLLRVHARLHHRRQLPGRYAPLERISGDGPEYGL